MESGLTSDLHIRSPADVEPGIRDILAISKRKGDRNDQRNETNESDP
jgi:hypothetical protein